MMRSVAPESQKHVVMLAALETPTIAERGKLAEGCLEAASPGEPCKIQSCPNVAWKSCAGRRASPETRAHFRPTAAQLWTKARVRPILARDWPTHFSGSVAFSPTLADFGWVRPILPNKSQQSICACETWPVFDQILPQLDQFWPILTRQGR